MKTTTVDIGGRGEFILHQRPGREIGAAVEARRRFTVDRSGRSVRVPPRGLVGERGRTWAHRSSKTSVVPWGTTAPTKGGFGFYSVTGTPESEIHNDGGGGGAAAKSHFPT